MSRLLDRIMRYGILIPGSAPTQEYCCSDIEQAIVVNITNVSQYFFEIDREKESWRPDEFPNLAPPLDRCFMEVDVGKINRANPGGEIRSVGVYLKSEDIYDLPDREVRLSVSTGEVLDPDQTRWWVRASIVYELKARKRPFMPCFFDAYIAPDGTLSQQENLKTPGFVAVSGTAVGEPIKDDLSQTEALWGTATETLLPAFMALSFMNCQNVKRQLTEPPPRLSRKAERKYGKPLVKYYTLEIDPMKDVLTSEGDAETAGLKRALHICRGHFRTYVPERGGPGGRLIEKPQTMWVRQHVRGSNTAGEVVKDYSLKGVPKDNRSTNNGLTNNGLTTQRTKTK